MGIAAIVMAGGRAERLGVGEKPLLKVGGKTMIESVIEALRHSKRVRKIAVAVSEATPLTEEVVRKMSLEVIRTPGEGYHSDMRYAIQKLGFVLPVLVVSADLPLLTADIVDEVVKYYERCTKPALTVVVPFRLYERIGLKPQYFFEIGSERFVPVGINIIDGRKVDDPWIEQEVLICKEVRRLVNVNRSADLKIAERLARDPS